MNDPVKRRGGRRAILDFLSFPLRAVTLFEMDLGPFSCLASERFYYVAGVVSGWCLDVGCGRNNRFVTEFLQGRGRGIDVFRYEGLSDEQVVEDMSHMPFPDGSFETVTFIANLNHVPEPLRDAELSEAYRCLIPGGRIVVTMGHPIAEYLVHKLVWMYDTVLGTHVDMDGERGMEPEEAYSLSDAEIRSRLGRAGFRGIRKKRFITQWLLNAMFVAEKPRDV